MPDKTEVYQTMKPARVDVSNVEIDEGVVVIDTRHYLEHSLAKFPGSVYLDWRDFSEMGEARDTRMKMDHRSLSRRLSTYGISPNTRVVVIGKIADGDSTAGRLAWALTYLGVKKVEIVDVYSLDSAQFDVRNQEKPRENVRVWENEPVSLLEVDRDELIGSAMNHRDVIIDVRSEREFLDRGTPQLGAINIGWHEFFLSSGRPNEKLRAKLETLNITPDKRILLVSERGVRSGAAAFALYKMGYAQAASFSAGLKTLEP